MKNNAADPAESHQAHHDYQGHRGIEQSTRCWLESVVIELNLCPFAAGVVNHDRLRMQVIDYDTPERQLEALLQELHYLDNDIDTETSLLILPNGVESFDQYLDLVALAEQLIETTGYEGIYQIATFHPDYRFTEVPEHDPANYTNRSPYPMLHLLREASLEKALANFTDPEKIPERNVARVRSLGDQIMKDKLRRCEKQDS